MILSLLARGILGEAGGLESQIGGPCAAFARACNGQDAKKFTKHQGR